MSNLDDAIKKIQDEANKSLGDAAIQRIAEFLIDAVHAHPAEAAKIMVKGKTLKGAMASMRDGAKQYSNGRYACITDQQGFDLVAVYYSLNLAGPAELPKPAITVVKSSSPAAAVPKKSFSVDLDDLLGGDD